MLGDISLRRLESGPNVDNIAARVRLDTSSEHRRSFRLAIDVLTALVAASSVLIGTFAIFLFVLAILAFGDG